MILKDYVGMVVSPVRLQCQLHWQGLPVTIHCVSAAICFEIPSMCVCV